MIISLVTILMLLSHNTLEENEIEWFFQNGENKAKCDRFEKQFLGWKMGSASGTSTKVKEKNKATEPNEERENELMDSWIPYGYSFSGTTDQSFKTSPSWKTLIFADSTIHYIPLEEMMTVRSSVNSFIPVDALDPFYLDSDSQADIFNHELFNSHYVYKVPTQLPQKKLFQKPKFFPRKNSKSSLMFCPCGLTFQKKVIPLLDRYGGIAQHPMTYYRKPKIEPGLLPEMSRRHTLFIHPRLLDMMKAMDRSILSYPSKFEYRSLDQIGNAPKRLFPNRYNERIIL